MLRVGVERPSHGDASEHRDETAPSHLLILQLIHSTYIELDCMGTGFSSRSCLAEGVPELAPLGCFERGRTVPLCPVSSDVDLVGYGESVIDLYPEIAHRAFNLLVPQLTTTRLMRFTKIDQALLKSTPARSLSSRNNTRSEGHQSW
jgi:hypothetical protein